MPRGNERWTRAKHAQARDLVMKVKSDKRDYREQQAVTNAVHALVGTIGILTLGDALDEIERLSTEIAYLWTAGNITPNPALELAYAVWEQKRCVAEGTRT